MKFVIVGAGAIGRLFGVFLSRGGHKVVFVEKKAEVVEAINTRGVGLLELGTDDPHGMLFYPAMAVTDAIVRLIPGVLGEKASLESESFSEGYRKQLDFPNYTRPRAFMGHSVPGVLLEGNHQKVKEWRNNRAAAKLKKNRPDLLGKSIRKG